MPRNTGKIHSEKGGGYHGCSKEEGGSAPLTAWICRFIRIMPIQLHNGLQILKQWEIGGKRQGERGQEISGDGRTWRWDVGRELREIEREG